MLTPARAIAILSASKAGWDVVNLTYSPEHEAFRAEVRAFLERHRGRYPKPFGVNRPTPEARAWQRLLVQVRTWSDLEQPLLRVVEQLIDFVTQDHLAD